MTDSELANDRTFLAWFRTESAPSAPRWSRSMTLAAVVGSLALSTLLIVTT